MMRTSVFRLSGNAGPLVVATLRLSPLLTVSAPLRRNPHDPRTTTCFCGAPREVGGPLVMCGDHRREYYRRWNRGETELSARMAAEWAAKER